MKKRLWKVVNKLKQVNERICISEVEIERKVSMYMTQTYAPILDADRGGGNEEIL